jgi:hypothetical protein
VGQGSCFTVTLPKLLPTPPVADQSTHP